MTPLHADRALAERIETLAARALRRLTMTARAVLPECEAASIEVGGGVAAFVSPGSAVNQALGIGFSCQVEPADIERVERFFTSKGARPLVSVCPLADPAVHLALAARGWLLGGFENVLVRRYAGQVRSGRAAPGIEIVEAVSEQDRHTWALAATTGFSDPLEPLPAQLQLGAVVAADPHIRLFLAVVDGCVAGTGALTVDDGVAWLSADATLPHFRRRGVQSALQWHRLRVGAQAGCDLAVSEAAPGSQSQRNQERAGFQVAYTRCDLIAPSRE